MKKLLKYLTLLVVTLTLTMQSVLATCNWSSIKQKGNTFIYSKECHLEVGRLVKTSKIKEEQVKKLNETIKLRELSLDYSNKRVDLWKKTTFEVEDRFNKQVRIGSLGNKMYFVGGVLLTILSVWGAGQLKK